MRSIYTTFFSVFLLTKVFAQPFQPDALGHVHGQAFRDYIAKEGFELVGAFAREIYKGDTVWITKVMKGGEWFYIDTKGNRFADEQAFKDYLNNQNRTKTTERFQRTSSHRESANVVEYIVEEPTVFHEMPKEGLYTGGVFLKGKKQGFRNSSGVEVVAPIYDAIEVIGNDAKPFLKLTRKGKQGLADHTGKIIVPVNYQEVSVLFDDAEHELGPKGVVTLSDKGYTLLRLDGTTWTDPQPYQPFPADGYILLIDPTTNKKGAMGTNNRPIVPVQYDAIERKEGTDLLIVSYGREYDDEYAIGAYDLQGNIVMDVKYQRFEEFEGHLWSVYLYEGSERRYGLFDIRSKTFVLPVEYEWEYYRQERIVVHKGPDEARIYGMINRQGEWILPPQYSNLLYKDDSRYIVAALDGKYGVLDTTGLTIIPFTYDYLRALNDCTRCGNLPKDQFIAGMNEKYGIIDHQNKVVLPLTLPRFASTNTALGIEGHDRSVFMDLNGKVLYTANFWVTRYYGGLIEGRTNDSRPVKADLYGHTVIGN